MLEERPFDTGAVPVNYAEGPMSGRPLALLVLTSAALARTGDG